MRDINKNRAQAIIVSAFLIAIGIVAVVVLLNSAILSVGEQPQTTEQDVDAATSYRDTVETESREALIDVNQIAVDKGLTNEEVNQTYVEYVENINSRMQEVYAGEGLVGITDVQVNSSFNNAWRVRKNRTTPPTSNTRTPFDTAFVVDTSGSMSSNDPSEKRVDAARNFVGDLRGKDRAAVVDFDVDSGYNENGLYKKLTPAGNPTNKDAINESIGYLSNADGATYLGGGLRAANMEYRRNGTESRENVVVALADGVNTQGWLHYEGKYVRSCVEAYCGDASDWEWNHEWGKAGRYVDSDYWICVSEVRGDSDCDFSNYGDTSKGWRRAGTEAGLNKRTLHQTDVAASMDTKVYTVLLEGTGTVNKTLMQEIADRTGGKYYETTDPDDLESIFQRIYADVSQREPIATGVNTTYRVGLNITDFPGNGNVTLRARENDTTGLGDLIWRMNVTNRSSSHPSPNHVVVDDGSSVLNRYDYSAVGGTPLNIDIMRDRINGYGRNMSSNLLKGDYNLTLEYSASVANVTYDIRVDRGANVTTTLCASPPCTGSNRQTVGSIHDANFSISYSNENIEYSEPIELAVNPVQRAAQTGGTTTPSSPSPSSTKVLNFSTPVYDYKSYYTFDQNLTDSWSDYHAFDASGDNNTMGLQPEEPNINQNGVEQEINGNSNDNSYQFGGSDYVEDDDGWNNIPMNSTEEPQMFTVSLWFRGTSDGVLFDASETHGGDDKVFQIAVDGNDVVWKYEDEDGNTAEARAEADPGGSPPWWVPAPVAGWNWHHVVAVGGWNNNKTQVYVIDDDGADVGGSDTQMDGRPMQDVVGSERLGSLYVGGTPVSGVSGRPVSTDFDGRIDDVRIYHTDMSNLSLASVGGGGGSSKYSEDFDSGGSVPSGWSINHQIHGDDADITSSTSNSGSWSIHTAGGVLEMTDTVDLSGSSGATLNYWLNKGDCCFSLDVPEGDDNLNVQYTSDSFVGWKDLETLDPDTTSAPQTVSVSIPNDGLDTGFRIRYRNPNADSYVTWWGGNREFDHWIIDDVEVTATSGGGGGGPSVTGTPRFVEEIHEDTRDGYITTDWQNFTDDSGLNPEPVGSGSLRLEDVEAELRGGEISVWVQSDTDNDGTEEEESNEIVLDGSGDYDVAGLSSNNARFRLRVSVDHPDTTDAPKFYDAQLKGST